MQKILFVGQIDHGTTSIQRMKALRSLGHDVNSLNVNESGPGNGIKLPGRVFSRIGFPLDHAGVNRKIIKIFNGTRVDILFVDKGLTITPATLKKAKKLQEGCRLVSYSPDDMMLRGNQSRFYILCVPVFDLHVTTKSYNVGELKKLGAKDVLFVENAYDPDTHRPVELDSEEKKRWESEVCFIGGYEMERFEMMLKLAEAGIKVLIRGPAWEPYVGCHENLDIRPGYVLGDDYARAICGAKVNLGFLRKVARDLQTTRSVEIPACGAFMLAERSDEHRALLEEGREADYFSSFEELLRKVKYYLKHEEHRERIAAAGRLRCLDGGYSNQDRMKSILRHLNDSPSHWDQ